MAPDPIEADELDCLSCGACCRPGREGTLLVPERDIVRWKRIGRPELVAALVEGHFGEMAFATKNGACVHLGRDPSELTPGSLSPLRADRFGEGPGEGANPNACAIYEERGTTCREFEKGSWQCREFRRDHGLDAPTSGHRPQPRLLSEDTKPMPSDAVPRRR